MRIEVDAILKRPGFTLEARLSSTGLVTALFGRSGAGKSTLTALITGLLHPTSGRVVLDDRVLVDTRAGIMVPPRRRRIGAVFQDGRLFPHLTVRQNLLYATWFRRGAGAQRLGEIAELLGVGPLLARFPATLSGGEKQRVAIGRALLAEPELLVLDEPLASLDTPRKAEILPYLERLRDELKLPMIYVSHALDEVVHLADTLVLLEAGRVAAVGPIDAVMSRLDLGPGTGRAEAGAVIAARVTSIDPVPGLATLTFAGGTLRIPAGALTPGRTLRLHIRARDVAIATVEPQGLSILNVLRAEIVELADVDNASVEVVLDLGGSRLVARVTRLSAQTLGLTPGRKVHALIKSVAFDGRLGAEIS
jgi:molybdate transport system ATP-binding protein